MNGKTFCEPCCEKLGVPSEDFEETVLRQCRYPHGWFLNTLQRCVCPACYRTDLELIRSVADCTSLSELRVELSNHYHRHPIVGFRQRVLRLRLSRKRLQEFAARFIQ